MQSAEIRLGTRGSPLALVQAEETRRQLLALGAPPAGVTIQAIRTTGDRITDRPLTEAGGKGLFTKEIDEALLSGAVDAGVHSAKDLPTRLAPGLVIAGCLPREDIRDAFISHAAGCLEDLPHGAVVGTSSLRRKALALRLRPDLRVVDMRGNVETRLRKLEGGEASATFLAAAGLRRLGLEERATGLIPPEQWLPAVGQGAIAIVARASDTPTIALIAGLDHRPTSIALAAERAYLEVLDGSCRTPIGGLARIEGERLVFRGIIVKPDGSDFHEVAMEGSADGAVAVGAAAGADLARRGGPGFFL